MEQNTSANSSGSNVSATNLTINVSTDTSSNSIHLDEEHVGCFKILCVSFENRKIGAACYEEHGQTVYYLRDTMEDDKFSTLRYLVDRLKPTHVLANSSANKHFRAELQGMVKCNLEDLSVTVDDKTLQNMHDTTTTQEDAPEFEPHVTAQNQTVQEEVPVVKDTRKGEPEEDLWFASLQFLARSCFTPKEGEKWLTRALDYDTRNSKLRSKLLFDSSEANMMSALGVLLRHINQMQIGVDVDPNSFITITSFKQINLGTVIDVDGSTLRALEIFEAQNDFIGSKINHKRTSSKHNFNSDCLFDFCNRCRSTGGKRKLKAWFSRPISTHEILKLRHDGISFFSQDCNSKFTLYLRSKIRQVSMLTGVISRMRLGKCPVSDWKNLLKTIKALIAIGDALREYELKLTILGPGEKAMGKELARIEMLISETFDVENSIGEERFVVNPGISDELDQLKQTFSKLGDYLTEVAEHQIKTYNFTTCSVCYLPIIGYLVLLPTLWAQNLDQTEFEIIYRTDQSVGFKTPAMHELDQKFGDIRSRIIDHETLISNSIQELVVKRRKAIFDAIEVASTLDCLISLAIVAYENDWCRPRFTNEKIINVQNGRHPIAEKVCRSRYVSNPIQSGRSVSHPEFSKVKVIMGPNASGKSVYLKTVGTLIYLAHIGSYIPADRAVFGPINRLISRMYTIDLVLNGLSSFGSDIKQMSDAISMANSKSVIIIDEFGKGTMTEVGLSLLASCLNYWLENETKCPHVFVSTHFHSLPNLLKESQLVSYNLMKVIDDDDGELQFTYEFVEGNCTHSYANYTAHKMGIKKEITDRAEEISKVLKTGLSLASVPSLNREEEQKMAETANQMELLMDDFLNWDMRGDPIGFLEKARDVLHPNNNYAC